MITSGMGSRLTRRGIGRRRRRGASVVALALLGGTLAVAMPAATPDVEAVGDVNLLFTRPGTTARYNANEVVALEAGNINFVGNCKTGPLRQKLGISDTFQPFADLYIVPAGSTFLNNGNLTDAVGAPNTVHGGLAGSFLYEPLGATAPLGLIKSGLYGIVVDECQNGVFDTGEDSFVDNAFRVTVKEWVPRLNPEVQSFLNLKSAASKFNSHMSDIERMLKFREALELLNQATEATTAIASPEAFTVFVINGAVAALAENSPYAVLKNRAKELAQESVAQHRTRMRHLAADPPDPLFTRPPLPDAAGVWIEEANSSFGAATQQYIAQHDALSALSGALLAAIERYQGAEAVGDATWALRHARSAILLGQLYEQQSAAFGTASDAFEAALTAFATTAGAGRFDNLTTAIDLAYESLDIGSLPTQARFMNSGGNLAFAQQVAQDHEYAVETDQVAEWLPFFNQTQTDVTEFASTLPAVRATFDGLVTELETMLGGRDIDPTLRIAVTGAPTAGSVVNLASTGLSGDVTVNWDLDGDGAADDASGVTTPWTIPADAMAGAPLMVSATASGAGFQVSTSIVVTVVAGGNRAPVLTPPTPNLREVAPGAGATLTLTASDPDGDALTYEWLVNGVTRAGATSSSFTLPTSPTDFGGFWVDVLVRDARGALTRHGWMVRVVTPDSDGDGYRAAPGPDCLDAPDASGVAPNLVRPNRAEIASNGADDDCNPATPDDGSGSVGSININGYDNSSVGDIVRPQTMAWTHPQRNTGIEYRLTVDWGDGSPLYTQTVAGTTNTQTNFTSPTHQYSKPLVTANIDYCVEVVSTGYKFCGTRRTISIVNNRPIVNAADWRTWLPVERTTANGSSAGDWAPADPDGRHLISVDNVGNMVIVPAPSDLPEGGYGRAALSHQILTTSDNDQIGLLFGFQPGEALDPNGDFIGVAWSNHDSTPIARSSCNDIATGAQVQPVPFSIWRQHGVVEYYESLGNHTLAIPYDPTDDISADGGVAQNPMCSDDQGRTVIGFVPYRTTDDDPNKTDTWRERRFRGSGVGQLTTATYVDYPYLIEYDYQPDGLRVWVDGDLHLDITPPDPTKPFPPGRAALFYQSQVDILAATTNNEPTFQFVQGKGGDLSSEPADGISVPMHDGAHDTHISRISWGDGTATTDGITTANPAKGWGWFDITGTHVYESAGTFRGEVCSTDSYGLGMCFPFTAVVGNVPPTVDAGLDMPAGADVSVSDMTFRDLGRFDVHTATIDWGDGTVPAVGTVSETNGSGTVAGAHRYASNGTFDVEVCVTDQLAAAACDTRQLAVTAVNAAPTARAETGITTVEGSPVDIGAAFNDPNPTDTHTVAVDWGDGSPRGPVVIQDAGDFGSGIATHVYADDGVYTVAFEACDNGPLCTTATTTVDVVNADPVITATRQVTANRVVVAGTYADPGAADTHTSSVQWGDGITEPAVVSAGPGGSGQISAEHTFASPGTFAVVVCVVDDDGRQDCDTASITIEAAPNVAPVVDIDPVASTSEGSVASLTGVFSDGNPADVHAATIDWGDGSGEQSLALGAGTIATSRLYADDGGSPFTVTVEVCDSTGLCGTDTSPVIVANVSPTVAVSSTTSANTVTVSGTYTDPGADMHTATVDWGDSSSGDPPTLTPAAGGGSIAADHTYAAPGTYSIDVCVTDDDGGVSCDGADVTIDPVHSPPDVDLAPIAATTEGQPASATATVSDGDAGDTHTARIDWGDGTGEQPAAIAAGTVSSTHVYADDAGSPFTVTVEVCDSFGLCDVDAEAVTVANVAPIVDAGRDRAIEFDLALDDSAFTDPGTVDTHTATVDWGDGSVVLAATVGGSGGNGVINGAHTYSAEGDFTVTICVTDNGGDTDCDGFAVTAANAAIDVTVADAFTAMEGSAIAVPLAFTHRTGTTHTVTARWGDGSDPQPVALTTDGEAGAGTASHIYSDNGTFAVTFDVCAGSLCGAASTTVTVSNVAPTIAGIPATASVVAGTAITLNGQISDPGADTHTAFVSAGGGLAGVPVANRAFTWTGTFTQTGQVNVTVKACDDDGACADSVVDVTVTSAQPTSVLAVSTVTNRSSSNGLGGATVSGLTYVFVDQAAARTLVNSAVAKVDFYLDGKLFSVENITAFDLARTKPGGNAYPLDTTLLTNGAHTVKASIRFANSRKSDVSATFTVSNGVDVKSIQVSKAANRANSAKLDGTSQSGKVAIFLGLTASIQGACVVFMIDGKTMTTECSSPYDLGGTGHDGSAVLYDVNKVSKGKHVLKVLVKLPEGVVIEQHATFTRT